MLFLNIEGKKVGFAFTGSFCTFKTVLEELKKKNSREYAHAVYLNNVGHFPVYEACDFTYFPVGDVWYKDLLTKLKNAKEYIFIEIFILAKGKMWESILNILEAKVKEGVEVRVLYDGTCSLTLLPRTYPEQLKEKGVYPQKLWE